MSQDINTMYKQCLSTLVALKNINSKENVINHFLPQSTTATIEGAVLVNVLLLMSCSLIQKYLGEVQMTIAQKQFGTMNW